MSNRWLCITIGISFHHGNKESATDKIKDIFGEDLKRAIFVHNDIMWRTGEYFCFVLCANYDSHLSELRKNSAFFHVIPSIDKPGWLTLDEVRKFVSSMKSEGTRKILRKGDIVLVKSGRLKNLYGLVVRSDKKNKYKVAFRFCLKELNTTLSGNLLKFSGSIFNYRKFPVTKKGMGNQSLAKFLRLVAKEG